MGAVESRDWYEGWRDFSRGPPIQAWNFQCPPTNYRPSFFVVEDSGDDISLGDVEVSDDNDVDNEDDECKNEPVAEDDVEMTTGEEALMKAMMAMCVRYFISHKQEEDEASYVSINFNEDGSGADTDNTYESIKSRYFEDSPQTAGSNHESASSGVASDVTSVYPATPTMTTFKGDSVSSACSAKSNGSQDSGNKSASLSSSPKPDQSTRLPLRGTRASPAPPLPPIPLDPPPPLPAKHPLRNASPHVEYGRLNLAHSESPSNPVRGKKLRDRRARTTEQEIGLLDHEVNGRTTNQVRCFLPQKNNVCYTCSTHDQRFIDSSIYNDINSSFPEAMREEQFIDTCWDVRCIDSHVHQDAFMHRDRVSTVPSPVSPVPPGGFYYNRDVAFNQQDQWFQELVSRDARARQKLSQQTHPGMQQYQPQSRRSPHLPAGRTSSPIIPENKDRPEGDIMANHSVSPAGNRQDRATPTNHTNRPGSAMSKSIVGPARQVNGLWAEQSAPHNPRSPNVFQAQVQVHQSDDRPGRPDSRMKLTNGHTEPVPSNVQSNTHRTMGLVGGVKNLSISQIDVSAQKSFAISPKGKKQLCRTSLFECLPNELLLKIFFHLPTDQLCRCAQVCRQWYNAVWDNPALWTSIVINNPNIDIDRALKYLTRRLSYNTPKICMILEKININFCSRLTDRGLQTTVKRCPELRYLDMQGCHLVTNEGVTEAVSRCVNLERLDATGCPQVTCITLMDTVLAQGPSNHLERIYLRYLDMTDCPHITDQDLFIITSQCTQLLFFYLRRCPLISDLGVTYIANNCASLRELSMSDCHNITDLAMRELAKLRDNLRYLSVAKCEKVSDEGVISIAKSCCKLRYLNVRGCEAVSDIGLEFLARNCPRLRSLDIGKCDITDEGLYALSRYCPNLKKLGVKSCDAITDKGIVLVAYSCPSLQQLHVQDCCLSADAYAMVRKYCKRAIIEHTNPGVL